MISAGIPAAQVAQPVLEVGQLVVGAGVEGVIVHLPFLPRPPRAAKVIRGPAPG